MQEKPLVKNFVYSIDVLRKVTDKKHKIIENERGMRVRDFSFPRKIHTTLNAAGEVGGGRSDPPPLHGKLCPWKVEFDRLYTGSMSRKNKYLAS